MSLLFPYREVAWSCLEAGKIKHFKCMSQTKLEIKGSRVNGAMIILLLVPAVEAGMDVESAVTAATVGITKATAGTRLVFSFL